MPPPTLEQLLNFFRDHPLPENPETPYDGVTVDGLPACGPDDSPTYRMLGYPNNPNGVFYLPPNQVSPQAPFPNPDDALLRRVLTGTGGLVYQREGRGAGDKRVPLGMGALHLCRSESPVGNSGRYTVSVSDNTVINNQPGNPAPLRRVNFSFTQPEIEAIVHGLRRADGTVFTLAGDHYQVDASNHSQLSLMPDRNELEQIIALIRANGSSAIPAGPRREEMIGRLQDFIRTEAAQGQVLDEQLRWPPWKIALYSILASVLPSIGIMY
ncbi:MAG TPA: hypothetical protein VFX30_13820, partial [bacterium]|nr:hypothetical protein [bacterium]